MFQSRAEGHEQETLDHMIEDRWRGIQLVALAGNAMQLLIAIFVMIPGK